MHARGASRRLSVHASLKKLSPEQRPASQTAIGVALLRAIHEAYDDSPKLLRDPVAALLVGDEMMQRAEAAPEWMQSALTVAIRSHVVLRSRYAEDRLCEAVLQGVRQYVILGAGYDTFASATRLGCFVTDL